MKVLIACEFSGIVRDAFTILGHDAWSCDLLDTEKPGQHLLCDIRSIKEPSQYDLLIAHPPCTYLCNSGVRWLKDDPARWDLMLEAAKLFRHLLHLPIPRICIENPIPHGYATEAIGMKYNDIIHPWQYGHPETKTTCLWLKNLPTLRSTNIVEGRTPRVHHASPGPDRWKERSRTLQGIANAMASQWGKLKPA